MDPFQRLDHVQDAIVAAAAVFTFGLQLRVGVEAEYIQAVGDGNQDHALGAEAVAAVLIVGAVPLLQTAAVDVHHDGELVMGGLRRSIDIQIQAVLAHFRRIGVVGHVDVGVAGVVSDVIGCGVPPVKLAARGAKSVAHTNTFPGCGILGRPPAQRPDGRRGIGDPTEQGVTGVGPDTFQGTVFGHNLRNHKNPPKSFEF